MCRSYIASCGDNAVNMTAVAPRKVAAERRCIHADLRSLRTPQKGGVAISTTPLLRSLLREAAIGLCCNEMTSWVFVVLN